MPLTTDYCTLLELKSFMRIADTIDDAELGYAITAASRAVDHAAGRRFGVDDPAVARVLTAEQMRGTDQFIDVPDISSVTGLVVKTDTNNDGTYETTLTINTDYKLWPYNAVADGRPYERVELTAGGMFPSTARGVEITAKWGWPSVPVAIKNATLVQAQTIVKGGRESPLGIAGSPEFGNELRLSTKLHPIAAELVRPYRKMWGWI